MWVPYNAVRCHTQRLRPRQPVVSAEESLRRARSAGAERHAQRSSHTRVSCRSGVRFPNDLKTPKVTTRRHSTLVSGHDGPRDDALRTHSRDASTDKLPLRCADPPRPVIRMPRVSRESAGMGRAEACVKLRSGLRSTDSSIADRRLVVPRDGDLSPDSRAIVIRVYAAVEHGPRTVLVACHFNRSYKRRSPVLAHRLPAVAAVLI